MLIFHPLSVPIRRAHAFRRGMVRDESSSPRKIQSVVRLRPQKKKKK